MASNKFDLPTPFAPAMQVKGPKCTSTSTRFLNPVTFRRVSTMRTLRSYTVIPPTLESRRAGSSHGHIPIGLIDFIVDRAEWPQPDIARVGPRNPILAVRSLDPGRGQLAARKLGRRFHKGEHHLWAAQWSDLAGVLGVDRFVPQALVDLELNLVAILPFPADREKARRKFRADAMAVHGDCCALSGPGRDSQINREVIWRRGRQRKSDAAARRIVCLLQDRATRGARLPAYAGWDVQIDIDTILCAKI